VPAVEEGGWLLDAGIGPLRGAPPHPRPLRAPRPAVGALLDTIIIPLLLITVIYNLLSLIPSY